MASKTRKLKIIRKNKDSAHKANRKAEAKRITNNYAVLEKLAKEE